MKATEGVIGRLDRQVESLLLRPMMKEEQASRELESVKPISSRSSGQKEPILLKEKILPDWLL